MLMRHFIACLYIIAYYSQRWRILADIHLQIQIHTDLM